MWGNLAGRIIAKTDIHATLEKIGNAVAPRDNKDEDDEDEDDEDEDDDPDYDPDNEEEEDDDDDDEEEYYEDDDDYEEDEEEFEKTNPGSSSYGLVGMLSRALDDRNTVIQKGNQEDWNDDFNREQTEVDFTFHENSHHKQVMEDDDFQKNKPAIADTISSSSSTIRPNIISSPSSKLSNDWSGNDNNGALPGVVTQQQPLEHAPNESSHHLVLEERNNNDTTKVNNDAAITTTTTTTTAMTTTTTTAATTTTAESLLLHSPRKAETTTAIKELTKNTVMEEEEEEHHPKEMNLNNEDDDPRIEMLQVMDDAKMMKAALKEKEKKEQQQQQWRIETERKRVTEEEEEEKKHRQDHMLLLEADRRTAKFEQQQEEHHPPPRLGVEEEEEEKMRRVAQEAESREMEMNLHNKRLPIKTHNNQPLQDEKATKKGPETETVANVTFIDPRENDAAANAEAVVVVTETLQFTNKEEEDQGEEVVEVEPGDRPETPEYHEVTRMMEMEFQCRELRTRLEMAEQEVVALRNQAVRDKRNAEVQKEELISRFQDKELRLLKATTEETQNQVEQLKQELTVQIEMLEQTLVKERIEYKDEQEEYQRLLRESNAKLDRTETQMQATVQRFQNEIRQWEQREERSKRKADDRVAQTMAVLDERNEEISHLKTLIRDMESKVNEHEEGVEEAEEELEELQHENDSLRAMIEKLQKECKEHEEKIESLEDDSTKLVEVRMEMTMIQEELVRERAKNQSVVDSAISSHSQIESERDSALSELRDIKQHLAAALGDLEIARIDNTRIMTANSNLQRALEAFQEERQAEMRMFEEQRLESEKAIKSAHDANIDALRQTHDARLYEAQNAANKTIQNLKNEMELLEGTIERLKSENYQMRRSLDEAIHRLQSTQEDVIDRNVMKNILLDWCMLKDKVKRQQVLEIMANLLHFTEHEKEKVHLTSVDLDSVGARFVGALAAPLPPAKADVEHLEGDNVREKWISFLMAETDDS